MKNLTKYIISLFLELKKKKLLKEIKKEEYKKN